MKRHVRLLPLLILLLLPTTSVFAGVLQGVILDDETGEPLAGTNVFLLGTHLGTSTDLNGEFSLGNLAAGEYTISVSHIGYASIEKTITLDDNLLLELTLKTNAVKLDEVVYTATRTRQLLKDVPVTTELVTRDEMEKSCSYTAAEALESMIGIDVREDFSGQGVMLQGIDPERVLILVDGSRVIGRVDGSIDLDQITTHGIKQIEVVKGAISTLYGSEAIGGVINVITAEPVDPLRIDLDLSGGGWIPSGATGIESTVSSPALDLSWKRGKLGLRGGVRYEANEIMDIDTSTTQTEGTEESERLGSYLRATYDISPEAKMNLSGRWMEEQQSWIEETGITSLNLFRDDEETNRRLEVSSELICTPAWAEHYSVKLYHSAMFHEWGKYTQLSHRRLDLSRNQEVYSQLSLQLTKTLHPAHLVTFGGDADLWNIDARTEMTMTDGGEVTLNVDDFSSDLSAWDAFLQDEWSAGKRLMIVPGIRFEQHEIYGVNLSPKLSVMWSPTSRIRIRSSVGKGYRAPSAKELYFTFNHSSVGYKVIGNPNLEPETSTNLNLSVEHTYDDRNISRITLFYNDLHNLIDYDSLEATDTYYLGIYQYENITSATTSGFELERTSRLYRDFEVKGSYSYLMTHNRETGMELVRRPRHTARWELTWTPGNWTARVWGRYVGKALYQNKFDSDGQTSDEFTEAYSLWSLAISRQLTEGLTASCKIENLLDHVHPRYGPFRGRVLTAGLRWSWIPPLGA